MSEMRGFRKAISKEEFQSRAHFLGLSEREIRYIINNTDFCYQTYINQQVCFLRDYLKKELNKTFFSSTYANVFNLNPRTVRRYLLNGPVEPKPLGRHMALDDSIENSIVIDIINREQTNPFTRKE